MSKNNGNGKRPKKKKDEVDPFRPAVDFKTWGQRAEEERRQAQQEAEDERWAIREAEEQAELDHISALADEYAKNNYKTEVTPLSPGDIAPSSNHPLPKMSVEELNQAVDKMMEEVFSDSPEVRDEHAARGTRPAPATPPADESISRLNIASLDIVKPELVEWLWPDRVPAGKLSLLIGDPGLGKSTVTLDIASRISTGAAWPGGGRAPLGITILLTAEDGLADTVRPRIDRQGGDPSQIFAIKSVQVGQDEREVNLTVDLERIEEQLQFLKPKLIVIDPLSAYLGDKDSYKDAEVRGLLRPLASLGDKYHVAILCVVHMNKSGQGKALYRALGSIGFVAAARSVLGVAKDPNDKDRRFMVPVKSNLAEMPPGLAYRFDKTGMIFWDETPVDVNADSLLGMPALNGDEEEGKDDIDEFLKGLLAEGSMSSKDVVKWARTNGFSERSIYRAKDRLGIKVERMGQGIQSRSYWSIPKSDLPISSPFGKSGKSGEVTDSKLDTSITFSDLPDLPKGEEIGKSAGKSEDEDDGTVIEQLS